VPHWKSIVALLVGVCALGLVTLRAPGCAHVVEGAEDPRGAVEAARRESPPAADTTAEYEFEAAMRQASFTARSRPIGFVRWSPDIAVLTLLSIVSPDVHVDLGREVEVRVARSRLHITTGILEYDFSWDKVESVYVRPTTDADLPFVLCVKTTVVPLIVLVDLDLGAETQAVAEAAMYYVNERRLDGG
jgi:hypothetical protein